MYDMNEYATAELNLRRGPSKRTWVALIPALAATMILLFLIMVACKVRPDEPAGAAGALATPSGSAPAVTPSATSDPGDGSEGGGPGQGGGGPGAGDSGSGSGAGGSGDAGSSGGGDSGDSGGGSGGEEPEEPVAPAEPLSIQATVNTVAPAGQCFASGTIAVSGGEYPVTVHYQWRRVALVDGQLGTVAVTPVQNITFEEAGDRMVQTNALPAAGPNVRIVVSGPKQVSSAWVAYESCDDQLDETIGG